MNNGASFTCFVIGQMTSDEDMARLRRVAEALLLPILPSPTGSMRSAAIWAGVCLSDYRARELDARPCALRHRSATLRALC